MGKKNVITPRNNTSTMFEIINIRHLAKTAKIDYMKLRNNIHGVYDSLESHELIHLFNSLEKEVTKACAALGFTYDGRPIKRKSEV